MDSIQLKAMTIMMRAAQYMGEFSRKDIKKYDLNITEFAVLELLYHRGEQPIQVIGKKILIASSSITYVVDKLEKKGYVQRVHCSSDRRVIYASITEQGRQLMDTIFPEHAQEMKRMFEGIDEQELQQLIEIAKKVGKQAEHLL